MVSFYLNNLESAPIKALTICIENLISKSLVEQNKFEKIHNFL